MRRALLQFVLFFAVLTVWLCRESARSPLDAVDQHFSNWLAGNAAAPASPAPLLLVDINDSTLENTPWPLSYLDYSLFFQAIAPQSPPVIAIAPVLRPRTAHDPMANQYREALHDQILRLPKVLLGARLGRRQDTMRLLATERWVALEHVTGDLSRIPEYDRIEKQPEEALALSGTTGFTNLRGRRDEKVYRAPLLLRYRGQVVPSFILQAAMLWHRVTPDQVNAIVGEEIWLGGEIRVPIDEEGRMVVDFSSTISRFGFDDLLLSSAERDMNQAPTFSIDQIKDKLVLLGRTDQASRTLRFPTGEQASMPELIARSIATLQEGRFQDRVSYRFDGALIVALGILGGFFTLWPPKRILVASGTAMLLYLLIAMSIYSAARLWVPITLPLGLVLGSAAFAVLCPPPRAVKAVRAAQPEPEDIFR